MTDPLLIPFSSLPGIRWPASPSPAGARLLALLYQFDQTQWWSADRIAEHQFEQIASVLSHAYQFVPFCRQKLQQSGVDPFAKNLRSQWAGMPVTTRRELQDAGDAAKSQAVPLEHGRIEQSVTSGSTGRPLVSFRTEHCRWMWSALTMRDHLWHQRDLTGRLAVIRAQPPQFPKGGVASDNWGYPTNLVFPSGPAAALNVREDTASQWSWLESQSPNYLLSHPTNVRALVDYAEQLDRRLPGLREIRTVGEMAHPDLRDRCRQVFGVPLVDVYSAQEAGYIALQCPQCDAYHVQAEAVMVEVLDEQNRPCPPGAVGRIVLTSLHNFAMPLIRYEILDYAEVGDACPCGRGLPTLKRIVGRQRNMLTLPDGRRCWPVFSPKAYLKIAPIRQLQIVQHTVDRIEARIAMRQPLSEAQREAFIAYLQKNMRFPCTVEVSCIDEFPPAANGKFEDFVSLVSGP